jgi:serine/threonine protein kinase
LPAFCLSLSLSGPSAECTKDTLRIFLELAADGSVKDILDAFGKFGLITALPSIRESNGMTLGGLAEPVLRRYTHNMLAGLSFLHSKGYIHRDIKPSNLLIDHNVVKLADFGCTTSVRTGQGERYG